MADAPQTATTDVPKGITTVDKEAQFDVDRLAYEAAQDAASKIAALVKGEIAGKSVSIVGLPLLQDMADIQSSYLLLSSLEQEFKQLGEPEPEAKRKRLTIPSLRGFDLAIAHPLDALVGDVAKSVSLATGILSPATAIVTAAAGLVSFFRQDVSYSGKQTAVDPIAFELLLANDLRDNGASKVMVPDLLFLSAPESGDGSLQARLAAVEAAKREAWGKIAPIVRELAQLEEQLDAATRSKNQAKVDELSREIATLRAAVDPLSTPFGRADQRLADLMSKWTEVDQSTGLSRFTRLIRAEFVVAHTEVFVHSAIALGGGYTRITRNVWRTISVGDGVTYTGGVVARWALFGPSGSIDKGGIVEGRRSAAASKLDK